MTILSFRSKQERIEARGAEYKAGEISEAVFRASLYALGLRLDDLDHEVRFYAPISRYDHEEARYQASLDWMERYLNRADST